MNEVSTGRIHADEAYSKHQLMKLLGISQCFWDKMLDDGLPYTRVGQTRWVIGENVLNYLHRNAERKVVQGLGTDLKGSSDAETT